MVRIISYKTRQREERATFCSKVLNIRNITKQTYLKIFPAIYVHFVTLKKTIVMKNFIICFSLFCLLISCDQQKIQDLEQEIEQKDEKISDLEENLSILESQLEEVNNKIDETESAVDDLENEVDDFSYEEWQSNVYDVESKTRDLRGAIDDLKNTASQ